MSYSAMSISSRKSIMTERCMVGYVKKSCVYLIRKARSCIFLFGYHYPMTIIAGLLSMFAVSVLWLIQPIVKLKVGCIASERIGEFAGNIDLFLKRREMCGAPSRVRHIFLAGKVCNRQLMTMCRRHICVVESRMLHTLFRYSEALWKKTSFCEPLEWNCKEYYKVRNAKNTLTFLHSEVEKGECFLKSLGLRPNKDWFVCIFSRDPAYLETAFPKNAFISRDWSYHDHRNSDIDTYRAAVREIIDRGGYVIRMGQHVGKPFEFVHEKVIDYAMRYREDFLDIYLMAHCRFVLGVLSGICDVPMMFSVPRICVNTTPAFDRPPCQNALFIPKKIRRLESKEWVPYQEVMLKTPIRDMPLLWDSRVFSSEGYEYVDNSEQDILDVTREMLDKLEGSFTETEANRALQEKYFNLFPSDHWAAGVKTPVGQDFIRKNSALFASV
jgi:putative glycosyltransferase (TIGR04372 family)